ncbi:CapA family protein [Paenibacillus abyssi]|uniref:Capsule synthesis protein CapA domain-containing protein n=1 Tax=Paenibacillus abyssi TaxID=1340531 RepID=A0A917FZW0_9BACL|nr:CapA family protein [Paenibacillus abyssi]GGG15668.1 hypothetical protein GCM10010916_35750 [Paenibacillus abyssi]
MPLSRSDTRQHNKNRKKRKFRRLLILNAAMLLLIIIISGLLLANHEGWLRNQANEQANIADESSADEQASNTNNQSNTANAQTDVTEQPGANEQPQEGPANTEDPSAPAENEGGSGSDIHADPNAGQQPAADENENVVDNDSRVLLAFVGDILLASSVESLMEKHGYEYPYEKALSYLADADLTAGNLENPITERGTPAPDKSYIFKGSPKNLPAFKDAGFDVVSLANNHTLDQGVEGLLDTMGHLDEAGIPHVGAGNDDVEAFTPVILESKGVRVAYLGLSRVVPVVEWKAEKYRAGVAETYDTTRAVEAIKKASDEADIVVVMVHWGQELNDYPLDYQKSFAREYIDAGADLVIGSHPHVLQGFEQYKGKWIAYSLGNFIFNMTRTERAADTGVLDATCDRAGDCSLRFHPMRAVASQPAPLEDDDAAALLQRIASLSFNVSIDAQGHLIPNE